MLPELLRQSCSSYAFHRLGPAGAQLLHSCSTLLPITAPQNQQQAISNRQHVCIAQLSQACAGSCPSTWASCSWHHTRSSSSSSSTTTMSDSGGSSSARITDHGGIDSSRQFCWQQHRRLPVTVTGPHPPAHDCSTSACSSMPPVTSQHTAESPPCSYVGKTAGGAAAAASHSSSSSMGPGSLPLCSWPHIVAALHRQQWWGMPHHLHHQKPAGSHQAADCATAEAHIGMVTTTSSSSSSSMPDSSRSYVDSRSRGSIHLGSSQALYSSTSSSMCAVSDRRYYSNRSDSSSSRTTTTTPTTTPSSSSSSSSPSTSSSSSSSSSPSPSSWVDVVLPPRVRPYAHLMRLDKPIGSWLLAWPGLWSIALAAPAGHLPDLWLCSLFSVGAVLLRGAGCTVNDLWDRDIDRAVERTRSRPLAAGLVTPFQALLFLGAQLGVGLGILLQLNTTAQALGASSLVLVGAYPAMKRITWWPQAFLGATINWGALMGWAAVHGSCDWGVVLPLYGAGMCWTLVYDTIYAHQDKKDDELVGVKSTARLFGKRTKPVLSGFAAAQAGLLLAAGHAAGCGGLYQAAVAAGAAHQAWQIGSVDLDHGKQCMSMFVSNKWYGGILFVGIVADRLLG